MDTERIRMAAATPRRTQVHFLDIIKTSFFHSMSWKKEVYSFLHQMKLLKYGKQRSSFRKAQDFFLPQPL